jgi:hypothetical protein
MASFEAAHATWMRQWREAARALDQDRRAALAALTDEQALAASEAVLSLAGAHPPSPARRTTSGLVEQQALFHRQRVR